mmetsp:Transcript_10492/g.13144  ORF Transcript_10492/g.13144 Transcript_10492/m.13144 type:complete len:206 (-) Transcript_10492:371-988(-)
MALHSKCMSIRMYHISFLHLNPRDLDPIRIEYDVTRYVYMFVDKKILLVYHQAQTPKRKRMSSLTKDVLQKVLLRIYEQGSELAGKVDKVNFALSKLEENVTCMNKRLDKLEDRIDKTAKNDTIQEPIIPEFQDLLHELQTPAKSPGVRAGVNRKRKKSTNNKENVSIQNKLYSNKKLCTICNSRDPNTTKEDGHKGQHIGGKVK